MAKTQKSSTEIVRELIIFRMGCEVQPWIELAKLLKEKNESGARVYAKTEDQIIDEATKQEEQGGIT